MRLITLGKILVALIVGSSITTADLCARELSLVQAVQLATDHAHLLKMAMAEEQAAGASLSAARRDRMPVVSAVALANYVSYVSSLDIALPGGPAFSREFGSNETYQADIRLTMPVFTGGRIGSSIDAASSSAEYYAAMAEVSEDQVVYQARVAYLATLRASRLMNAAEASLTRARTMFDDVKSGYAAGIADTVDLLEAELAMIGAENNVTAANIALRRAGIQLATRIGLSATEPINLTDSLVDPPQQATLASALEDKPEIAAARAGVGLSRARSRLEAADYWPSLSVYGGYSYGKPNLDRFNNTWNDYFTVGAQLSWSFNLGNKTGKKRLAAHYQLEAANRHLSDVEERLQEQAQLASEEVRLARSRFTTAEKEHGIARERFHRAQLSLREGAMAPNRLIEIEAALTVAESSLAAARADYYIAQSGYLYAVGSDDLRKGL